MQTIKPKKLVKIFRRHVENSTINLTRVRSSTEGRTVVAENNQPTGVCAYRSIRAKIPEYLPLPRKVITDALFTLPQTG